MQKTKLGISVGLLAAAVYFMGLFSGYVVAILLTGYILLFEENEWLRKNAVKAVVLMTVFSLLSVLIGFIPTIFGMVDDAFATLGGNVVFSILYDIISIIEKILGIIEKVIFLIIGFKALKQQTTDILFVDNIIEKYM